MDELRYRVGVIVPSVTYPGAKSVRPSGLGTGTGRRAMLTIFAPFKVGESVVILPLVDFRRLQSAAVSWEAGRKKE